MLSFQATKIPLPGLEFRRDFLFVVTSLVNFAPKETNFFGAVHLLFLSFRAREIIFTGACTQDGFGAATFFLSVMSLPKNFRMNPFFCHI
jgi:hypothetical protein